MGKYGLGLCLVKGLISLHFDRKISMQNQNGISLAVKHMFRENKFLDDFIIIYRSDIGRGELNIGPQVQE